MTGFHLSGYVLPDGEHRDLWIADGVIRTEPVAGAETLATRGWLMPGLVDAHCHVGLDAERRGAGRRGRAAGAGRPGRRCPADPRRRQSGRHQMDRRPRGSTEDHPGRPAHRPTEALHPQLRRRGRARGPARHGRATGRPWRRLGEDRRRLDRPGRRRPGAAVAGRRGDGRDRPSPPAGRPGHRPRVRRAGRRRARPGRDRRDRARHRTRFRHADADGASARSHWCRR